MQDFLGSQLFATVVGAVIALAGTGISQYFKGKKQRRADKKAAIEELLIAVRAYHFASRRRFAHALTYKYQRQFAEALDRGAFTSGMSTAAFHQQLAVEALNASNAVGEEAQQLSLDITRYSFRLSLLFPNDIPELGKLLSDAMIGRDISEMSITPYETSEQAQEDMKARNQALKKYKDELWESFKKLQAYLIVLGERG